MAKRRPSAELIKAFEFHAKVVDLLRTRHSDWSEWEETFLLDNAQRPGDFIYSEAQWAVLNRLASYSRSFTQYNGYTVQELLGIAYRFRYDLDEDAQEFLEKLDRWKAIDLKCRQIRWLAGLARMFEPIGRDDLDYVEEEDPTSEAVDLTRPNTLESARYYSYRAVRTL
jgi:hypothetical protein